MKNAIMVFLLFVSCCLYSQPFPQINSQHPRLYVSQSRFNFLDSNRTIPPVSTFYNQFTNNYFGWWYNTPDFYLVGSDSTQWIYVFRYFTSAESAYKSDLLYTGLFTAFIYKINHDPVQLKRTRFIIRKYISAVDTMNYAGYSGDDLEAILRYYSMLGSALHDWCYSDVDTVLRNGIGSALYKLNRKFMNSFIFTSGGNSYVSSHNAWNCVITMQNVLSLYSSNGITPIQNDSVNYWYMTLCDKWNSGFLPVYGYYRSSSGGWNWGAAYSMWSLTDQFTLFENFLNGTNKNYYQDLPWILNSINQYYFFLRPDGICIHLGDGETGISGDNVIYSHAKLFSDQRSRYLAQKYSETANLGTTYAYFNVLCYKDFFAPAVSHPALPLNWLSEKTGLLVSRSSWDSTAVMYWLYNALSKKAAHEHNDNNTFAIYYKKPLLLDAGYYDSYGSSHYKNYYMRTAAHNTVTVFDPSEQFVYAGNIVSNDGGQIMSPTLMNYNNIFEPAFQRGRWIIYAQDSNFVYSNTDASLSFNQLKVKRHLRKILFQKPNRFIILDNVILPDGIPVFPREVRWNAHFRNQPHILGNIINTQVPGHIENFSGRKVTSVYNPVYITFNSLSPDSVQIRRIGGDGYEYWVNGQNYPPSVLPDSNRYNPGKWRIEEIAYSVSDTINFLHTGFVSDVGVSEPADAIRYKNVSTIGCEYFNFLYLFNIKGDTGTLSLSASNIQGNRSINVYSFDLRRNTNYNFFLNGVQVHSQSSDSNGMILKSLALPAGVNNLQITTGTVSIKKQEEVVPPEYYLSQNYPNPFNTSTVLNFALPFAGTVSVSIYDITGREAANPVNRHFGAGIYSIEWNASDFPSGIYFLKFRADSFYSIKKIILMK